MKTVSIVGFLETRVNAFKAKNIASRFGKQWHWEFNYDYHANGRIWLEWDHRSWKMTIIQKYARFIHCKAILIATNEEFLMTFNSADFRKDLWHDLV